IMASVKERRSEPVHVSVHFEGAPEKHEAEEKALREGVLEQQHVLEEKARLNETAGRIMAVLDAGERARWNALQGAPFAFAREGEIHAGGVFFRLVSPSSPERP